MKIGIFTLVSVALLAVGSSAGSLPLFQKLKDDLNTDNYLFQGKRWVVLVAGSDGWWNYRHQADICHAYQVIKANGIPEENIITLMKDDIAFNENNPTPGIIINQPNGTDVYKGVVIDYSGDDVTSNNFINVITGNKKAMEGVGSGKVIEGAHRDSIFIYFADHGGTGILGFPNDYLYADVLIKAFNTMYCNASYKKLLFYVEACEAGSMFDGLLSENKNVLAVTASGPRESSYGCYCGSESITYQTCLGDLFSVQWLENLDETRSDPSVKKKTIFHNYNLVRNKVDQSNVMIYGDFSVGDETLSTFIGYPKRSTKEEVLPNSSAVHQKTSVSSRDITKHIIEQLLAKEDLSHQEKFKLGSLLRKNNERRIMIDGVLLDIYEEIMNYRPDIKQFIGDIDQFENIQLTLDVFPCYRSILSQISESCFSLPRNPYVLGRLKIFANLCSNDKDIHTMIGGLINESCSNIQKNILNVF